MRTGEWERDVRFRVISCRWEGYQRIDQCSTVPLTAKRRRPNQTDQHTSHPTNRSTHLVPVLFNTSEYILRPKHVFPLTRLERDDGVIDLFLREDCLVDLWMGMDCVLPVVLALHSRFRRRETHPVGRECALFDDDTPSCLCRTVERDEQGVDVTRQCRRMCDFRFPGA